MRTCRIQQESQYLRVIQVWRWGETAEHGLMPWAQIHLSISQLHTFSIKHIECSVEAQMQSESCDLCSALRKCSILSEQIDHNKHHISEHIYIRIGCQQLSSVFLNSSTLLPALLRSLPSRSCVNSHSDSLCLSGEHIPSLSVSLVRSHFASPFLSQVSPLDSFRSALRSPQCFANYFSIAFA